MLATLLSSLSWRIQTEKYNNILLIIRLFQSPVSWTQKRHMTDLSNPLVVTMRNTTFWVTEPCSSVEFGRHLGGTSEIFYRISYASWTLSLRIHVNVVDLSCHTHTGNVLLSSFCWRNNVLEAGSAYFIRNRLWEPSMETFHMLRTLITDPQQYYSASIRCYATAGKHVAHLLLTCGVAGETWPR
jgi:hypothetical protein